MDQGLAYTGYITVNWTTVHKDVIKRLDVNRSGKFDASDVKSLTASTLAVLSQVRACPAGACPAGTQLPPEGLLRAFLAPRPVQCMHGCPAARALCSNGGIREQEGLRAAVMRWLEGTSALLLRVQGVPSTGGFCAGLLLGLK